MCLSRLPADTVWHNISQLVELIVESHDKLQFEANLRAKTRAAKKANKRADIGAIVIEELKRKISPSDVLATLQAAAEAGRNSVSVGIENGRIYIGDTVSACVCGVNDPKKFRKAVRAFLHDIRPFQKKKRMIWKW
jgi:hypothetical protein